MVYVYLYSDTVCAVRTHTHTTYIHRCIANERINKWNGMAWIRIAFSYGTLPASIMRHLPQTYIHKYIDDVFEPKQNVYDEEEKEEETKTE